MSKNTYWIFNLFNDSFWQGILINILWFSGGYFISWYKRNSFYVMAYIRLVKSLLKKKKYILIWNDDQVAISEKICAALKKKGITEQIVCLKAPIELLKYPLRASAIQMIVMIVSDVTKLAADEEISNLIENRLIDFVSGGGTLFGTHDLIYSRCRNKSLQVAYGCEINNFQRFNEPILTVRNSLFAMHPLLTNIPETFSFDDGEVCWGHWGNDSCTLLFTKEKINNIYNIPMLVTKQFGHNGTLIWLNSGDKGKELCKSLTRPQPEIITLMANAITLKNEISEFTLN